MSLSVGNSSFHSQFLQLSKVAEGGSLCIDAGKLIRCSDSKVVEALEGLVSRLRFSEKQEARHRHKSDDEVACSFLEYLTNHASSIESIDNQALLNFSNYFQKHTFTLQTKTVLLNLLETLILRTNPFFRLFCAGNKQSTLKSLSS